jgi:hypothetical protein
MQGEETAIKIVQLIWKHIQVIRSPYNIQPNYLRNKIKVWEYIELGTYNVFTEMNFQIFFFSCLCQNTNHNQTGCLVPFIPATAK